MNYIFIYPNKKQLEEIQKIKETTIIIVKKNLQNIDFDSINKNYNNYKVLCCNEEALYCFYKFFNKKIKKSFSDECKKMFNKKEAKKVFKKYDINHIKCETKKDYPLIAKPEFGFGSIAVKMINNDEDMHNYLNTFKATIENSAIYNMQNTYFSNFMNKPIFEHLIQYGYFYSVPFFYNEEKDEITIFPIKGDKQIKNRFTDSYWTSFIYDEESINKNIYGMIKKEIHKIAKAFKLKTSVNMSEVIYDYESDTIKVIEFSPRVPGGKLSKLVKYGSGIDLDELSIKACVGKNITLKKNLSSVQLTISSKEIKKTNNTIIESEQAFSHIFNKKLNYSISKYNYKKVALIPGRFAPLHKGHQLMIEKALKEVDKIVLLIFDTDDINVPLKTRANWIRKIYPQITVIEGYNCPDGRKYAYELGQKCAFIQNKYINEMIKNQNITHVYHSVTYGDSVSKSLNAIEVMVDLDRNKFPVSGTLIRSNLEKYKEYLNPYIYNEYKKTLKK